MDKIIQKIFAESIAVKQKTLDANHRQIAQAAKVILACLHKGGKVLLFGNGGSAADSQHMAAEFIGRFQKERRSIPAIALTTDTSILTALANDYSYDIVFSRQIEGLGCAKDVAIGFTTSGNSKNVIEGIKTAKKKGLKTISFSGHKGGTIASLADVSLVVPSTNTARIQESHICMAHVICELVENHFGKK